jgi:hypothetical protein
MNPKLAALSLWDLCGDRTTRQPAPVERSNLITTKTGVRGTGGVAVATFSRPTNALGWRRERQESHRFAGRLTSTCDECRSSQGIAQITSAP